ncbi:MAG: hypothetical protein KDD51_03155 [Bdellovibrionales bacterium]|nr:hypothetical protein [Bdellovibrionales bacterium]
MKELKAKSIAFVLVLCFIGTPNALAGPRRNWGKFVQYCDMALLSAAAIGFTIYVSALPPTASERDSRPPAVEIDEADSPRGVGFELPPGIPARIDEKGIFHVGLRNATGYPVEEWTLVRSDVPPWAVIENGVLHAKLPLDYPLFNPIRILLVYETPEKNIVRVPVQIVPVP